MRELIQELHNKYQNDFTKIENEELYLCIDRYKDKEIKKVFFDFSKNIPKNEEELNLYNERFIAPLYYEDRGSIQWNYYVIFVVNSIDDIDISWIEKNKDYARKIVLKRNDFNNFLRNDDFIHVFYDHEVDIAPNLLSQWDLQLEQNRLEFICNNTPKSKWIDKLLSENDAEEVERTKVVDNNSEKQLDTCFPDDTFIQNLNLNGYRPFPAKREFDFRKVNLIQGVNGSGKTSLLEAIEIITCGGKTNRSKGEDEPNIQNLTLRLGNHDIKVFSDNNIYKNRDKVWYGSTNERGNKLYENFNRFNFYHAEAASDISEEKNINNIIKNIVLGNDVAKYEKKISDSKDEFSQEIRRIDNKYIPNLENDIKTIKEQLSSISKTKQDLSSVNNKFKEILNFIGWKKEYPAQYEKQEDIFFEIADLDKLFDQLYSLSRAVEVIDISDIDKDLNLVNKNNIMLQDAIKNMSLEQRKKEEFSKKIEDISQEIASIDKLSQWIDIDNISKILGLDEKLSLMKKDLIALENIFWDIERKEYLEKYLENNMNLLGHKEKIEELYYKQIEEKQRLNKELNEKEADIGLLNTYKTNLQNFARKTILLTNQKENVLYATQVFKKKNSMI